MHLIDTPTATRDGHFTEGDPLIPLPATVVSADWLNAVQDEIASLVEAAQLPLDKRDSTQLRAAVQKLSAAAVLNVVKVDGKTLFLDKGGALTAQDVAIGGDAADLASGRGQIGNAVRVTPITDFDTFTKAGFYWGTWTTPTNGAPPLGVNAFIWVSRYSDTVDVVRQTAFRWGTPGVNDWQIFTREQAKLNDEFIWTPWRWILTDQSLGDGLRFSNGKFSVPEYSGATSSTPGTSGLVPPAAAGEQSKFFTGDGTYKEALTPAGGTLTGNLVFPLNEEDADVKTMRLGIKVTDTDGTARTFYPIRVIPGSAYGRGLILAPSGPLILGGGESAQTFAKGHIGAGNLNGETEYTFITSDSGIEFYYGQNAGYDVAKKIAISAAGAVTIPGNVTIAGNTNAKGSFNGLGSQLTSSSATIAADLNPLNLTGWYAVRPATLNKPDGVTYAVCMVVAHDNDEIHQHLFCGQGIYHRYISITNSVYQAWAKLFDSNFLCVKAATAERLRNAQGKDMIFSWQAQGGQPAFVWGGNEPGTDIKVWNPANFNVNYATSAGTATNVQWSTIRGIHTEGSAGALPAGGTWMVVLYDWWYSGAGEMNGRYAPNVGFWAGERQFPVLKMALPSK